MMKSKRMTQEEIRAMAARYPRFIRWSDEDNCYIGSLPDLCGDCTHGDTPEEVLSNLVECAELCVDSQNELGFTLPPPRSFVIAPSVYREKGSQGNVQALRRKIGLSQADFAKVLGVSKTTVSHWEQGTRKPDGSSARLLQIAEKHPEALLS